MKEYIVQAKTAESLVQRGKLKIRAMDRSPGALTAAFNAVRADIQAILDRTGGSMLYDASTIGKPGEHRDFMLVRATEDASKEIAALKEHVFSVQPSNTHKKPKPGR